MRKRFRDTEFTDHMADIVALKQLGTVEEYYEDFLSLLNSLQLSADYALSIFISNLKLEISKMVRLFCPKTLSHAFSLAKQLEALNQMSPRKPFVPYKNPPQAPPNSFSPPISPLIPSTLPPLLPTPNVPMLTNPLNTSKAIINPTKNPSSWNQNSQPAKGTRMPTRQERDERRKNGLCMWCGIKFTKGHTCLKSQLYHILIDSNNEIEEEDDLFLDCPNSLEEVESLQKEEDRPMISLHALTGTKGYQTMRVQGLIKNQLINILIDTGSTHNFVDGKVLKVVGEKLHSVNNFTVTVANGEKLQVQEWCPGLIWEVQGLQQSTNFFVLPLRGCDMVLGIQWLITLGPIL